MCRVRWARLGWAAASLCAAPSVWGQPTSTAPAAPVANPATYSLSWVRAEGAEACPTARSLASEVERRLGRPVFDAAAARSFEVQVTRVAGQYRSDVFVRDETGRALGRRSLQSDEPNCTALFGATALAIALVIDPEAASRDSGSTAIAAFDVPPTPLPPPPVPAPPPPAPVVVVAPAPAPAPVPPAPLRTTLLTVSARGQLSGGLLPEASPGVGLAFSARPSARFGVAASASYSTPQSAQQGGGDFIIGLTRASLALSFDAAQSRQVRFVLTAGTSLGAFHVAVRQPTPVTDPGDFWFLAAELGANLQVGVSGAIFVELGGAAALPLIRQEFFVKDESQPVWSEPWAAGTLFLGLGARFP